MKIIATFLSLFLALDGADYSNCEDIQQFYMLDPQTYGTLKHTEKHYESEYLFSCMYSNKNSVTGKDDTKYLFYPLDAEIYNKNDAGETTEKEEDKSNVLSQQQINEIIRSNRITKTHQIDTQNLISFPYVILPDKLEEKPEESEESGKNYVSLTYDNIFDYLKPYIVKDSGYHINETKGKESLNISNLDVWKFFIINQLMVSLKMMNRFELVHMNIDVSSVMLRSKTEAGWFDTDMIRPLSTKKMVDDKCTKVKKFDKNKQPIDEFEECNFIRYNEFKLYSKQKYRFNEYEQTKFHDYYYKTSSNVAAFAILIVEIFTPGFSQIIRNNDNTNIDKHLEYNFNKHCETESQNTHWICTTHMKTVIIEMLNVDLDSEVGIEAYYTGFVSSMLDILEVYTSTGYPDEEKGLSSPKEVAQETQDNYKDMVNLRIKDKYENCKKMPFKKTVRSHILSFCQDKGDLKEKLKECTEKEKQIKEWLENFADKKEKKTVLSENADNYDSKEYSGYPTIAEYSNDKICMKAFFEDEALIFAKYAANEDDLKNLLASALELEQPGDGILDIWVEAIKNNLPNQFLPKEII